MLEALAHSFAQHGFFVYKWSIGFSVHSPTVTTKIGWIRKKIVMPEVCWFKFEKPREGIVFGKIPEFIEPLADYFGITLRETSRETSSVWSHQFFIDPVTCRFYHKPVLSDAESPEGEVIKPAITN